MYWFLILITICDCQLPRQDLWTSVGIFLLKVCHVHVNTSVHAHVFCKQTSFPMWMCVFLQNCVHISVSIPHSLFIVCVLYMHYNFCIKYFSVCLCVWSVPVFQWRTELWWAETDHGWCHIFNKIVIYARKKNKDATSPLDNNEILLCTVAAAAHFYYLLLPVTLANY